MLSDVAWFWLALEKTRNSWVFFLKQNIGLVRYSPKAISSVIKVSAVAFRKQK